jgi:hypothetical protein
MPFLNFAKFLKTYAKKEMVHIKVIFNKTKIAEYTFFNYVSLKKILPKIKNNKIYSLSLLYKEYGDYVESEISEYILFKYNDELFIYQPIYKKGYCYLKDIVDINIYGSSTKKVIVEELSFRQIYGLEILVQNEKGLLFTKRFMMLTNDENFQLKLFLKNEIEYKYQYEILDFETEDDEMQMKEGLEMEGSKVINKIRMVLNITKEKSLYERFIYKINK